MSADVSVSAPEQPSRTRRFFRFVWSEIKGLLRAFWHPFWMVTLGVTLAVFCALLYLGFSSDRSPSPDRQPLTVVDVIVITLVLFGVSLYYAFWVGLVAGGMGVLWRLVGGWIILPIILIPTAVLLSVWLCSGWIMGEGRDALEALAAAAKANGLPETEKAAKGLGKGMHGGGLEMIAIFLVLMIPFLVYDALWILLDGSFLWQFLQFVLTFLFAVSLGLVPSALLSMLALFYSLVKRIHRRYRRFLAAEEAVVAVPPPAPGAVTQ